VASSPFTLLLMKPASILLCLLMIVGWCASGSTQAGTFKSEALSRSTQMIVVTTSDWNAVEGRLQRYERPMIPMSVPHPIQSRERETASLPLASLR